MPFPPRARLREDAGPVTKLIFLRLVVATLVVGAAALVLQFGQGGAQAGALYGLLGVTCLATGSLYLAARAGASWRSVVWTAVVIDCATLTAILHFSGGSGSQFAVLFVLPIVMAGAVFETAGGLAAAALATAAYVGYALLEYQGRFGVRAAAGGAIANPLLRGYLLMAVYVLTGLASGSHAARGRRAREELARAEDELRRTRLNADSVFTHVSSGLVVANRSGEIQTCNPAAARILGVHRPDELSGRPVSDVLGPENALVREIETALATGTQRRRHEIEVRRPDGTSVPLGVSISHLRGDDEESRGVVAIFQDLTEARKMREQVRRADKMAAIGELSTSIAHEIRAPLASICGSIEMLSQELELDGDNRKLMELVLKEADRLDRIITDFLEFARLRRPAFEPVDVERCLDEVLLLLRHSADVSRNVEIAVSSNAPHACVFADDEQIRQVFLNLVMNACEAMAAGGRLAIRIDRIATALRDGAAPSDCVAIDFRNTGPAIPADVLPHIFEPFYTTKEGGTGLGLAIVSRIVESHGGHVRAASAAATGAVFSVVLPMHGGTRAASEERDFQESFISF